MKNESIMYWYVVTDRVTLYDTFTILFLCLSNGKSTFN